MFKLPTTLAKHLEQEIHTKLVKAVEDESAYYNNMWAEREEKGEKFHTTWELITEAQWLKSQESGEKRQTLVTSSSSLQ